MGRPSTYSEELAEEICNRIIDGMSMIKICEQPDMPPRRTVIGWMEKDESFRARCARAREEQAEFMDDRILDVADNSTPETAQSDKVKISAYQWRASKLKPKKYGDKTIIAGDSDNPLAITEIKRSFIKPE